MQYIIEYINNEIVSLKGIYIQCCAPYIHVLKGTAAKYHRDIMDISRCILAEAKVRKRFSLEIVKIAILLRIEF